MFLSRVVFEIFNVEKCRDFEIWVKGHSRSLKPTRIDPPPMTSYSIVNMGLSGTVSETDSDFSRELQKISHPRVFYAPADEGALGIGYRHKGQKTRMMLLSDGRKVSR